MKPDWFWIATAVLVAALLIGGYLYLDKSFLVEDAVTDLNNLQQGQLNLYQQRISVLLTVSTLVIGGAGALLVHFNESSTGTITERRIALLALIAAGLSVFLGYMATDAAIWMLRNRFFNLETLTLKFLSVGQIGTSAIAVVLLAWCFVSASMPARR